MIQAAQALLWAKQNPVKVGAAVGLVAALLAIGVQTVRLSWEQSAHEKTRTAMAEQRAAHEREKAEAAQQRANMIEQFRATERALQNRIIQKEKEHAESIKRLNDALAVADVQLRGLRNEIAAYARGPADPALDTLAAARERAEALGVLLAKAEERARRDAEELETLNEEKRLLLATWPTSVPQ